MDSFTAHRPCTVYLAGEIHSPWRDEVTALGADLPVLWTAPETAHAASDAAGDHLGRAPESSDPNASFWRDTQSAGVNAMRTRTAIRRADFVVVRFGERYKQWNAAFDAGYAAALGKPVITLHSTDQDHALKEVDAAACATATTPAQVVQTLRYAIGR